MKNSMNEQIADKLVKAGAVRQDDGSFRMPTGPDGVVSTVTFGGAAPGPGHNAGPFRGGDPVQGDHLKSFVARIERLEDEKRSLAGDIREVYAEAKGNGYNAQILRKVVALRARDLGERREEEALLDLYLQAVGEVA